MTLANDNEQIIRRAYKIAGDKDMAGHPARCGDGAPTVERP